MVIGKGQRIETREMILKSYATKKKLQKAGGSHSPPGRVGP